MYLTTKLQNSPSRNGYNYKRRNRQSQLYSSTNFSLQMIEQEDKNNEKEYRNFEQHYSTHSTWLVFIETVSNC